METLNIVSTYKELNTVAGNWPTIHIKNDYIEGSNTFTITYNGQLVIFKNDDLLKVASCASQYNGLSHHRLMRFNPNDYL